MISALQENGHFEIEYLLAIESVTFRNLSCKIKKTEVRVYSVFAEKKMKKAMKNKREEV